MALHAGPMPVQESPMPQTDSHSHARADHVHSPNTPAGAIEAGVVALPTTEMARFCRLMQYEGWSVDVARMCADATYAYACLATAHTSGDERLRSVALYLFESYGRKLSALERH
jgi:hypothetical protein